MEHHPIENLMGTSMESIREMVDVGTVIGDPVKTQDGSTIIPVSKVSFGFVAGGGEYAGGFSQPMADMPFAGGAGAGVTVQPMGFLVCTQNGVRMLSADCTTPFDKLMEMIPQAVDAIAQMSRKEEKKQDVPRVHAAYQDM